jgi:hypothetical protein
MRKRKCGECTECCTHIPVKPLNKPAGVDCQHQCKAGCAIYETKPECCTTYSCSWLEGELPAYMRPDKCGMILEKAWVGENIGDKQLELMIVVHEDVIGTYHKFAGEFKDWCARDPLGRAVLAGDGPQVMGSLPAMKKVAQMCQEFEQGRGRVFDVNGTEC